MLYLELCMFIQIIVDFCALTVLGHHPPMHIPLWSSHLDADRKYKFHRKQLIF